MPEVSGIEAARWILAKPQYANIPILAMTAHAMVGDKDSSLQAGMKDHLVKPIVAEAFYAALQKWLPDSANRKPEEAEMPPSPVSGVGQELVLPGVNYAKGVAKVMQDHALFRRLLGQFYVQNENVISKMEVLLQADDLQAVADIVHNIKGVAGNLGMEKLYFSAVSLERCLKENSFFANESLGRFQSDLEEVLFGLKALNGKVLPKNMVALTDDNRQQVLAMLRDIEDKIDVDVVAVQKVLDAVGEILVGSKYHQKVDSCLDKQMHFDSEGLRQALAALRESLELQDE